MGIIQILAIGLLLTAVLLDTKPSHTCVNPNPKQVSEDRLLELVRGCERHYGAGACPVQIEVKEDILHTNVVCRRGGYTSDSK